MISLIFAAVTLVVTVTYVLLVMHADNDGEGGIMTIYHLDPHRRRVPGGAYVVALAVLGIFGASLFFGDSVITPGDFVLSAVRAATPPRRRWPAWSSRSQRRSSSSCLSFSDWAAA